MASSTGDASHRRRQCGGIVHDRSLVLQLGSNGLSCHGGGLLLEILILRLTGRVGDVLAGRVPGHPRAEAVAL